MAQPKKEHKPKNVYPKKSRARDSTGDKARTPNQAQRQDKMQRALDLRKAGLDYRRIASELGTVPSVVYRWVQEILQATPIEGVDELRQVENERLDRLRAMWTQKAGTDIAAAKMLIQLSETSCKINGVFAPIQVEDVTPPPDPSIELVSRLAKLLGK